MSSAIDPDQDFWIEILDTESGLPYFYHAVSQKTQWTRPTGTIIKEEDVTELHGIVADDDDSESEIRKFGDWLEVREKSGSIYWYNEKSKESTWENPLTPATAHPDQPTTLREALILLEQERSRVASLQKEVARLQGLIDGGSLPAAGDRAKGTRTMSRAISRRSAGDQHGLDSSSGVAGGGSDFSLQMSFLKSVPLFHSFTEAQFAKLIQSLRRVDFDEGDFIIRQNEPGERFFIIEQGKVSVLKMSIPDDDGAGGGGGAGSEVVIPQTAEEAGDVLAELGKGSFFGEKALMTNERRAASCIAITDVVCFSLDRRSFKDLLSSVEDILGSYSQQHYSTNDSTLQTLPLARHVGTYKAFLAAALRAEVDLTENEVRVDEMPASRALVEYMSSFVPELGLRGMIEKAMADMQATCNAEASRVIIYDQVHSSAVVFDSRQLVPSPQTVSLSHAGIAGWCILNTSVVVSPDVKADFDSKALDIADAPKLSPVARGLNGISEEGEGDDEEDEVELPTTWWQSQQHLDEMMGAVATYSIISVPVHDSSDKVVGVVQCLNRLSAAQTKDQERRIGNMRKTSHKRRESGLLGATPGIVRSARTRAEPFTKRDEQFCVGFADGFGLCLEERNPEVHAVTGTQDFLSLQDVKHYFRVKALRADNLPTPLKRKGVQACITAFVYHGKTRLCEPVESQHVDLEVQVAPHNIADRLEAQDAALQKKKKKRSSSQIYTIASSVWNSPLAPRIRFCDLPLATKIMFQVSYSDGTVVGWAGCKLLGRDKMLQAGKITLKLWPGELNDFTAGSATSLDNAFGPPETPEIQISLLKLSQPIVAAGQLTSRIRTASEASPSEGKVTVTGAAYMPVGNHEDTRLDMGQYLSRKEDIAHILGKDPLQELSPDDKVLLWSCREHLTEIPEALPKVLLSVRWDDYQCVEQAHRLLDEWVRPQPLDALQLLDMKFPDPVVRAYAVSCLEQLDDADLKLYMLQLTQVLKFEMFADSALARFLLRRALRHPRQIGHVFFWYLKAEMHIPEVSVRYGALLEQYLRNCGEHSTDLGHQRFVMTKLEDIAMKVKAADGKGARLATIQAELPQIVFPESFQLPLSPEMVARGLVVSKCRVMSSKKLPLWLTFEDSQQEGQSISVLFKAGDDLRQDQLTLQILGIMDKLWKAEGLDLCMSPYRCVSTGDELGMLEVVLNSTTLAAVVSDSVSGKKGFGRKLKAARGAFNDNVYIDWLRQQDGNEADMDAVKERFARSCAGYCVATYVLGIGDRHNDNLMITRDGRLFHIDFGHFLGNFKSKYGYKRERAPFVFTPPFAAVMDGVGSPCYQHFEDLCCQAYNILRKQGSLLITLFFLMLSCGIPELQTEDDIKWLQAKLMLEATDEEAAAHLRQQIDISLKTRTTQFNDAFHLLKHA